MAVSVKMSSKNQIVVPKAARDALGLAPGDRLLVTVREDGVVEMQRQPDDLADRLEGALRPLVRAAGDAGSGAPAEVGEAPGAGEERPGLWRELSDA